MKKQTFWIATGGTAGHIFPALAVADALFAKGARIIVSTDGRGKKYITKYQRVMIWASGVGAKNPIFQSWSLFKILVSAATLSIRFIFSRPDKIVAFGGYSSVPVLAAGWLWRIPTFLHEQNAAIGRANQFALPFVKTLMASFPIGKGVYTGLPVRKEIRDAKRKAIDSKSEFRLLVMGGSLGAKVMDDVVPKAISEMKDKKKLFVIHQSRQENIETLRKIYAKMGVKNNVLHFIKDMAGELASASLVICRGGASTVAEMQTIGVPAIIVPLGINPDQLANANAFAKKGGGIVIKQKDFSPELLAKTLGELLGNPAKITRMASAAKVPNNAVENIVKLVYN